ncbi:MAG: hypothetical protein AB7G24_14580 [Novosphingobium sp.]
MLPMLRTDLCAKIDTTRSFRRNKTIPRLAALCAGLCCFASPHAADAYTITITPGSRALYLQVGAGGYSGYYISGGTPGNNSTINTVSVTVPAASVGSGTALAMTSNSTASQSPIDGYTFCNPPSQVYIGAWSRPGSGGGVATLTVTSPANLTSGGDTIPFSQISWVMSGNGDVVFQFPNGTFTGGTQTLANFPANSWKEQCMTFSYANTVVPAAGTYKGRATYTLSLP